MKVSDEMVEAALCAFYITPGAKIGQFHESNIREMRATIEAAIAAHVPISRSQAAKARWAKTSPMERHQHMKAANKKRHPNIGY